MSKPGGNPTELTFGVGTTGTVSYTWETIPAGTTGAGTFTGSTATITGIPANAIIRLYIDSVNFNRININYGIDKQRLVDVEQWGSVAWTSMESAFYGCSNLNISSTDIPNLNLVTSMSGMFRNCSMLNGPLNINSWNTSNVWMMESMFKGAVNFNQPIGNWNTSNVNTLRSMFEGAVNFNQPIGNWNTNNFSDLAYMFRGAVNFNQPIGNWNTSSVNSMEGMFNGAVNFNQPIGAWNTNSVWLMAGMFEGAVNFNQPIGAWNTSNVTSLSNTFYGASSFNQNIGTWVINQTANLSGFLTNCGMDCTNYSATLYGWATNPLTPNGKYINAGNMHYSSSIQANRDYLISTKLWGIIGDALNIGYCCSTKYDTINITTCNLINFNGQTLALSGIYKDTLIDVNGCDSILVLYLTSSCTTDTLNVSIFCTSYIFNGQTLTSSGVYFDTLMNVNGCDSLVVLNLSIGPNTSVTQVGATLTSNAMGATYQWLSCPLYTPLIGETNQSFTATINGDYALVVTLNGCTDTSACYSIITTCLITRWDMSMQGGSSNTITFGVGTTGTVNYTWETIPAGVSGSGSFSGSTATISGIPTNGTIRLYIEPTNFNRISINNGIDKQRLIDVEQWGSVAWTSMQNAFYGCNNLNITSIDIPNLNLVNSMNRMFHICSILNGPMNINSWNTSNITNMSEMFKNATIFNQPIGNWNTTNVTNMGGMFLSASNFNEPIGNWNTANVADMNEMFGYASNFNQPIGGWNTANVLNMNALFYFASNFDQPIGGWNTANVSSMQNMFIGATNFNQPIGNWNTANVSSMQNMFYDASSFNQPIGNWILNPNVYISKMLDYCGMDCSNYSTTLNGWATNPLTPNGINLGAQGMHYSSSVQVNRDYLINTKGWTIDGDVLFPGFCYPTSTNDVIEDSRNISVYPNPTNTELHIRNSALKELQFYNSLGQLLFTTKRDVIDVSTYAKGIYYLKCEHQVVKVVVE